MTGTSLDALDASCVLVHERGLGMRIEHIWTDSFSLAPLDRQLRSLCEGEPMSARQIASLRDAFSELHARELSQRCQGEEPVSLVAAHGQTVFHESPHSWQLFNPWAVAHALRCPVVHDLRGADLALGGQGAPITPIADWILFRDAHRSRAIVNLGGFCNITLLPSGNDLSSTRAFDVCACNHILNACAQRALDAPYDEGGSHAMRATPDSDATLSLTTQLRAQSSSGRSLGTGDECLDWVERHMHALTPESLLASATHAIAQAIVDRVSDTDEIYLAGGSTRNLALLNAIEARASRPVRTLESLGVNEMSREPVALAALGALCMDRVPITISGVTGRQGDVLLHGCWANAPIDADTLNA